MGRQWKHFVADECGALLIRDWILLATILVIAVVPSMYGMRDKNTGREVEQIQAKKPATPVVVHTN